MTRAEWEQLAELMEGWWPGEFADHEQAAYFVVLERFDGGLVAASVKSLVDDGVEWRPAAPTLVVACLAHERGLRSASARALPAQPAGRNAPKLVLGAATTDRARGPHRECGGMLMEQESEPGSGGLRGPLVVQCERCLETFGQRSAG